MMITITGFIGTIWAVLICVGIIEERNAIRLGMLPDFTYYKWASLVGFLFVVSLVLTLHLHNLHR